MPSSATRAGPQSGPALPQMYVQTCTGSSGSQDPGILGHGILRSGSRDPGVMGSWGQGSWGSGSWGQDPGVKDPGSRILGVRILGPGSWVIGSWTQDGRPEGRPYGCWTLALSKHPSETHGVTGYPGHACSAYPGTPRPSACPGSTAVARTADPSPTRCRALTSASART